MAMRRQTTWTSAALMSAAMLALGCSRTGLGGLGAPSASEATGSTASVSKLMVGHSQACVILKDGRLKCWGRNDYGQLGLGDANDRGDEPDEMGDNLPAVDLGTGAKAAAVAVGAIHTCALLEDGRLKCWGSDRDVTADSSNRDNHGDEPNEMGDNLPAIDLGTGAKAVAITAGFYHTCALLEGGSVKCWGNNFSGMLGLGDTQTRGDEPNELGDNLPTVNLGAGAKAVAINAGQNFTCALLADDRVKCWGENLVGELGLGDTNHRGDEPNEMGDNLPAVDLGTGAKPLALEVGEKACVLMEGGRVKCWGSNRYGASGVGDSKDRGDEPNELGGKLPPIDFGKGTRAVAIAGGINAATCALLEDDRVKCWGDNFAGALGLGDLNHRGDNPNEMGDNLPAVNLGTGMTAASISGGIGHTCALLKSGAVKCWGGNAFGELGQGDKEDRGDEPNEMGDDLPALEF